MHVCRIALLVGCLFASVPALALDALQFSVTPGAVPPTLPNDALGINRADKRIYFKNIDGTVGVGSLLNATTCGRAAIEQGDISCLTVRPTGAPGAPSIADAMTRIVDVADYRLAGDGADWGPAFERARAALAATGGVLRVSTPGTLTIATPTKFPKGKPFITLRCDSRATNLTNAPSLKQAMFEVGGPTAAAGAGVDAEGCTITGANLTDSYAFSLRNANTMTFRRMKFVYMKQAILSEKGYALSLDDVEFDGVVSPFQSTSSAHNFVARRVKAYGGGTVYRFDEPTDNVSIVEGDYEHTGTVLQTAGGTSLRFSGNYVEYQSAAPFVNTGPMYGADITNNWIALGQYPWALPNFVGGQFKRNTIYNQTLTFAASTVDIEVADNVVTGTGFLDKMPHQSPALVNAWTQQSNYAQAGFRLGGDGLVRLRGNLLNSTAALGLPAFTLPAKYRPATVRTFATGNSSGGLTALQVNPDGTVVVNATSGQGSPAVPYQVSLDGVAFEPGT